MQPLQSVLILIVSLVMPLLSGCGNSSGSPATTPSSTVTDQTEIFGNTSTANGKTGITLTCNRNDIDSYNSQVAVTAKIIRNSTAVSGVPVNFTVITPTNDPTAVEAVLTTVTTDCNGVAVVQISAVNFLTTTNVIVQAKALIGAKTATAITAIQLPSNHGVIMFTDKAGTPPGGQTNMLEPWVKGGVDPAIVPYVTILQLLPFKVTDSNGDPRVGVPITLSTYSFSSLNSGDAVTVDFLVPPINEPDHRTITTDSAGMGIFNIAVTMKAPPIGSFTFSSVVFKATTNDDIPVTAYVGATYSITAKLP